MLIPNYDRFLSVVPLVGQTAASVFEISAGGVTLEHGLTTTRRALSDTLRAALTSSAKGIGLIDSSKFGLSALVAIARPEELDAIVVDDGLSRKLIDDYEAAGVNLVFAGGHRTASSVA